ncbi:MAG: response regulator [Opitutaceae bacterium]
MATIPLQPEEVIFAADDDEDDIDLLRLLLRKAEVTTPLHAFQAGEDLVEALSGLLKSSLQAMRPLLFFLDIKMPAMNGYDILRWIREQKALDAVPVVVLSSSDSPADVARAAKEGAQCYLTKYPHPSVLKQVVDEAERFAFGAPASECFCLPTNQLLVRARRV